MHTSECRRRRTDIYRLLIARRIIVLFHNRDIHDGPWRSASMTPNRRTDPLRVIVSSIPVIRLSPIDCRWQRADRPVYVRINLGKDLSRPSIVYNGLNDLDFILRLEPQTANNRSRAIPRAVRRRTSTYYSRRIAVRAKGHDCRRFAIGCGVFILSNASPRSRLTIRG